jgi:hypothetical protein
VRARGNAVGEPKPRPGDDKLPPSDLTSSDPDLDSLGSGEELLRKAQAVSRRILERVEKLTQSARPANEDLMLLAETFKRVWKVMGTDPVVREDTILLAETFRRLWKVRVKESQRPLPTAQDERDAEGG